MDPEVCDRRDRQVRLQALPVFAVVERCVEAKLGADVDEASAVGIFAHGTGEVSAGDAVFAIGQQLPAPTAVVGAEDVGLEIVLAVAIDGDEDTIGIVGPNARSR